MPTTKESIFVCNGASNHTKQERELNDFYATSPEAAHLLLKEEKFKPYIWECACGAGHLAKVFKLYGYNVYATDIIYHGYGLPGIDFLKVKREDAVLTHTDIITNPPYSLAKEFVEHGLELLPDGGKLAMFLKLTFLESKSRKELFLTTPPLPSLRILVPFTVREKRRFSKILERRRNGGRVRLVCVDKRFQRQHHNPLDKLKE